jgi:hypothetical protein
MESDKYHVVYEHYRVDAATGELKRYYQGCSEASEKHPGDWSPAERGGETICYIYPEGKETDTRMMEDLLSCGAAKCSLKDAFSYRLGRQISYGRAMKDLQGRQHG